MAISAKNPSTEDADMVYRLALLVLFLSPCSLVAEEWETPRMPWGEPDLQGIWTSATVTTLHRPEEIEQLVLTEAQAAAIEKHGEEVLAAIDDVGE